MSGIQINKIYTNFKFTERDLFYVLLAVSLADFLCNFIFLHTFSNSKNKELVTFCIFIHIVT